MLQLRGSPLFPYPTLFRSRAYIVVRATIVGPRAQVWRKELDAYVQRGLRVRTQLAGITGQQYLAVDFVDPKTYPPLPLDRKSTRLNSSHVEISYAVLCLKK